MESPRENFERARENFDSRVRTIRSKNLRNFLTIYFYTYVYEDQTGEFAVLRLRGKPTPWRKPRFAPGLRAIQELLQCSRATAQSYLRAINVTHEIFMRYEAEKYKKEKLVERIKAKDLKELRNDLANLFEKAADSLGVKRVGVEGSGARKYLSAAAGRALQSQGALTPKDCAKIFQELASWFV